MMATCKDCLHVDVCKFKDLPAPLSDSYIRESECIEKRCGDFKDRSRFVELPCKVGDMVYMITEQTQKVGRKKVTKTVIVECCVDNFRIGDAGYPSAALCDNENAWCYGVEPKMFGEIIFLSREEAEQALKEREENAN
jgi:hypothetical protein